MLKILKVWMKVKKVVKRGGGVAGEARENIESQLSRSILSKKML
jgi:hypothetical protein